MRYLVPLLLIFALVLSAAEEPRVFKVTYSGGSLSDYPSGEHMRLYFYQGHFKIFRDDFTLLDVFPASVLGLSFGHDLRRVGSSVGIANASRGLTGVLGLPNAKRHFLAIAWDREGRRGGAAFEIGKSEYQKAISELQQFSDKKAIDADTVALSN